MGFWWSIQAGIILRVMRSHVAQRVFQSSRVGMLPEVPSSEGARLWATVCDRGGKQKDGFSRTWRVLSLVMGREMMTRREAREKRRW